MNTVDFLWGQVFQDVIIFIVTVWVFFEISGYECYGRIFTCMKMEFLLIFKLFFGFESLNFEFVM